jgi:hypothetical protein
MKQLTTEESAMLHQRISPLANQLRDLLIEIGSVASLAVLTPEERARDTLSLSHPGPDTYERERLLNERIDKLSEAAINAAVAAVLEAVA